MQSTRRDFLGATVGAAALAACQSAPGPRTTDQPMAKPGSLEWLDLVQE